MVIKTVVSGYFFALMPRHRAEPPGHFDPDVLSLAFLSGTVINRPDFIRTGRSAR